MTAPVAQGSVTIDQNLTLGKRIGRGNLGVVYAAVHQVLARRFAVKVLRASLTGDDQVRRRLRHTVRQTSAVVHANVVSITDFGQQFKGLLQCTNPGRSVIPRKMGNFGRRGLPVGPVKRLDPEVLRDHPSEAARVNAVAVRVGSGHIEGLDPADIDAWVKVEEGFRGLLQMKPGDPRAGG